MLHCLNRATLFKQGCCLSCLGQRVHQWHFVLKQRKKHFEKWKVINALVKKTVLTLKYSFYSKKQRRYFFLTWKWMLLCGKKYIFSFRTFFFKTKDGKSLWERKKIFFLSQTAIKTFCESKMMNASQKEKFWSFTNNAEKKRFCESEQHKMIFFAFFSKQW